MGVTGLLPFLRNIGVETHISEFSGQTIGIDGYAWLHKSVLTCAKELALGEPSLKYVDYFENRIRLFRTYRVEPYFVFDGDHLPTKSCVEGDRRAMRESAREKAMEFVAQGLVQQANQQFQRCVDVTPTMASTVIELLKCYNVKFVVAPYEADAELRYLELKGHINAIMAEDSDLLIFGAQRLLTKFENDGRCIEFARERFPLCSDPMIGDFNDDNLRTLAILSGCDYSPGVYGIGISRAHILVRRYRSFDRILRALRLDGKSKVKIPQEFEFIYLRANLTFQHQRVFCPDSNKLVMLNPLVDVDAVNSVPGFHEFIGPDIEPGLSQQIALGKVDPFTKTQIKLTLVPSIRTDRLPVPLLTPKGPFIRSIKSYASVISPTPPTPISAKPVHKPAGALLTPRNRPLQQNALDSVLGLVAGHKRSLQSTNGILSPLTPSQTNVQKRSRIFMTGNVGDENSVVASGYFGRKKKKGFHDKWSDASIDVFSDETNASPEHINKKDVDEVCSSPPEPDDGPRSEHTRTEVDEELPVPEPEKLASQQQDIDKDCTDVSSSPSASTGHTSPTRSSGEIASSDIESPERPSKAVSLDEKLSSFSYRGKKPSTVPFGKTQKNILSFLSRKV